MSLQDQYENAEMVIEKLKKVRELLDEINKVSSDFDNLEDAIFALMDDASDAASIAQKFINEIDEQGGLDAVERHMAAEFKADMMREE